MLKAPSFLGGGEKGDDSDWRRFRPRGTRTWTGREGDYVVARVEVWVEACFKMGIAYRAGATTGSGDWGSGGAWGVLHEEQGSLLRRVGRMWGTQTDDGEPTGGAGGAGAKRAGTETGSAKYASPAHSAMRRGGGWKPFLRRRLLRGTWTQMRRRMSVKEG